MVMKLVGKMKRLLIAPLLISGFFSPAIADELRPQNYCLQAKDYQGCMKSRNYQNSLDSMVPNPEFCQMYGASAVITTTNTYVTLNPSTSFVSQPYLQPGCVIRRENWFVLQKLGVISYEDVRECKQRLNTFAYLGSIREKPVVQCVYQTDINDNKFLK